MDLIIVIVDDLVAGLTVDLVVFVAVVLNVGLIVGLVVLLVVGTVVSCGLMHLGICSHKPDSKHNELKNCCLFSNTNPLRHVTLTYDCFERHLLELLSDLVQCKSINCMFLR